MRNAAALVVFATFAVAAGSGCATGPSKPKDTIAIKPSDIHKSLAKLDKRKPFTVERHKVEIEKTGVQKYDDFLTEAAAVKGSVVVTNVVLEDIEVAMNTLANPAAPAAAAAASTPPATGTPPADGAAPAATTPPADGAAPATADAAAKKDDDDDGPISATAPKPIDDYDVLANAVAKKRGSLDLKVVNRIHTDVQMLDALMEVMKDVPGRAAEVTKKGQGLAQAATQELTKDPFGLASVPGALAGALGNVASAGTDAPGVLARSGKVIKALAICGCGNGIEVLKPADISPAFGPLFDKNPFANADTRVDYVITDLKDYDSFFKDVAVIRGQAVMVDVWVKEVAQTLADISKQPIPTTPAEVQKLAASLNAKKTKPNGDIVMRMKNHVAQLQALVTSFATTPAKVVEITSKAKQIPTQVASDALKAPAAMAGVPAAVEESAKAIIDSGKKVTDVVPTLQKLVAPLTALAAG